MHTHTPTHTNDASIYYKTTQRDKEVHSDLKMNWDFDAIFQVANESVDECGLSLFVSYTPYTPYSK